MKNNVHGQENHVKIFPGFFDKNISQIANDYMEESVRKMESMSNVLNSIGIILVSIIIGWVVLGTFQMQEQITSVFM